MALRFGVRLGLVVLLGAAMAAPVARGQLLGTGQAVEPSGPGEQVGQAESPSGRPRRIKWFHFEERPRNPTELPEHWFAMGRRALTSNPNFHRYPLHQQLIGREGFPRFTEVRFDTAHQTSGEHSLYLGLNGGSVGAFLEVGAITALANSDYQVTAALRTTSLQRARARLTAYFIDHQGKKIDASEAATALTQTDGKWQTVSVKLLGDHAKAAWIGMQVELRQPQYDPQDPLGKYQVVREEISGAAWFDDIAVWQLPRLVVRTQSDVNIIRAPDKPQLTIQVVDMTGRPLRATVTLYDHLMNPVVQMQRDVGPGAPPIWRWTPPLKKFGWYLMDLQVYEAAAPPDSSSASSQAVARTVSSLLWLDDEPAIDPIDAMRFGIIAEDLPMTELKLLGQLLELAKINAVVLSAWKRDLSLNQVDRHQRRLDGLLQGSLHGQRQITMSLYPLPDELAQLLDISSDSPIDMFDKPINQWRPYLAPVLMRHAQRVHRWQIGRHGQAVAFYDWQLPQRVNSIRKHLSNLAPEPIVVLPWNINQSRRRDVPHKLAYTIDVPHRTLAQRLGSYVQPWTAGDNDPGADFVLSLEIPPADAMSHRRRIDDLVLRLLYAWEAGAGGLQIDKPWTMSTDRHKTLLPDPLLGAFTTVAHRLAGRKVVGRLPLDHGLASMIFDGRTGGMLAAWNRSADPADAAINMFLGIAPVAVDIWGNRTPLPLQDGRHHVKLSTTPTLIEGIDPKLALFRAAFRVDLPFIESRQVVHHRTLTLRNPWPQTISGHMTITEPDQWRIQPQRTSFSIAAGQKRKIPITLRFPISELAGRKKLVARFDFLATRKYVIDVSTPMELGLEDIEFDANLSIESNPTTGKTNAVVTALITNKGDKLLSLRAFAIMPGYPRRMQPIPALMPGQSVVRRFEFQDIGNTTASTNISVGLRELTGPTVLNQVLPVGAF